MITVRYPFETTKDVSIGALANSTAAPKPGDADADDRDNYAAKLVKYVPAPVLAIFTLVWQGADTETERWVVYAVIGLFGTLFWLLSAHFIDRKKTGRGTPVWFFVLGLLSFVAWSLGTTDAGTKLTPGFQLDDFWAWFIFIVGAFFIPGIDDLLTNISTAGVPSNTPAPAPPNP